MGKASRKHAAQRERKELERTINRDLLALALRKTILAVTDFHGADCLLYTSVGAKVLQQLGLAAVECAGSSVWRVGPGDSDVISHAPEISGQSFAPVANGQVAIFHAWIELGTDLIDFSTSTLKAKGDDLVAMTGEPMNVEWAPDYLWVPKSQSMSLKGAVQAPTAPAYAYKRSAKVEDTLLLYGAPDDDSVEALATVVLMAYRSLLAGENLQMVGVGPDGSMQTEPAAKRSFKPI